MMRYLKLSCLMVGLLVTTRAFALESKGGGFNPTSNPVTTAQGGSGASLTPTIGDMLYATSSSVFGLLNDVAVGSVLVSGGVGVAPLWSTAVVVTGAVGSSGGGVLESYGGAAPTLTAGCNGAGVTAITGTNAHGHFTTQTAAATTCTITWSAAGPFHGAPDCMFYDNAATTTPVAFSTGACGTTTCVVDFASVAAKAIGYICIGS